MVSSLVWAAIAIVVLLTRKPLFGIGRSAEMGGS
jgi:hypothetical protein